MLSVVPARFGFTKAASRSTWLKPFAERPIHWVAPMNLERQKRPNPMLRTLQIAAFFSLFLLGCEEKGALPEGTTSHIIVGSTYAHPNSTWWGYNMSKVVTFGDTTYVGVIRNDSDDGKVQGEFTVLKSVSGTEPVKIASFTASRPGNLLVDSVGMLHVIVFEATDASINDSVGDLVIYSAENANPTEVDFTRRVLIEAPDPYTEVVNIRLGAAMGKDSEGADLIAIGSGICRTPNAAHGIGLTLGFGDTWSHECFSDFPPTHATDYYYPFLTFAGPGEVRILPVQDFSANGEANIYHKVPLLSFNTESRAFTFEMLRDASETAFAKIETNIMEQKDLFYEDSEETLYSMYSQRIDEETTETYLHTSHSDGTSSHDSIEWARDNNINWYRLFDYEGHVYAITASWDKVYVVEVGTGRRKRLSLEVPIGVYPYIASPRSGSPSDSPLLAVFLISGNNEQYPNGLTVLHLLPKKELVGLLD